MFSFFKVTSHFFSCFWNVQTFIGAYKQLSVNFVYIIIKYSLKIDNLHIYKLLTLKRVFIVTMTTVNSMFVSEMLPF